MSDWSEQKHDYFESVRVALNCNSVWSIYEVDDMLAKHPYAGATKVVYRDHWGIGVKECNIDSAATWASLFIAADECIRKSGDAHHIYIELFEVDPKDPTVLVLQTGS
jgi:hypothetical protein